MADYAIFQTGGKQYRVATGDIIKVEKLNAEGSIEFDQVLMVGDKVGTPYVEGAKVTGKVEKHGKQKKVIVYKYRQKTNYRRRQGHRQPYSKVVITSLK